MREIWHDTGRNLNHSRAVGNMRLALHKHSNGGWIIKFLALLLAVGYIAACVGFAIWLTGSTWFGVPLGFILSICFLVGTLVLLMNTYDKLIIPILRRRRRLSMKSAENCGRYGDPGCEN